MADPDALTPDTVIERNESLLSAEVGSDLVMLHVEKNAYYDTDAIGADIWRQLERPTRIGDLCAALVERYDVAAAQCEADVLAFLRDAYREGLIRIA